MEHRHSHEQTDAPVSTISKFLIWMVIGGFLVWIVLAGFWQVMKQGADQRDGISQYSGPREFPPGPRLQISPRADLAAYQVNQHEYLRSYGWVDQKAGTVHIPIEQAMDLLLQRGVPARQEVAHAGDKK